MLGISMTDPARPISVLLVEDSPGDVLMVRQALGGESLPIRVRVALDGEQAVHERARLPGGCRDSRPEPPEDLRLLDPSTYPAHKCQSWCSRPAQIHTTDSVR